MKARTTEEKRRFALDAARVLDTSVVRRVLQTSAHNLTQAGVRPDCYDLLVNELWRVISIAAQAARAQALGIDPEEFRLTPDEAREVTEGLVAAYAAPGRTVVICSATTPGDDEADKEGAP